MRALLLLAVLGCTAASAQVRTPSRQAAHNLFGAGLAFGDFDGDGRDDLAISAPGDADATITVLYAEAPSRGRTVRAAVALPASAVGPTLSRGDGVLASGDFDGDGYADLAVGLPEANQRAGAFVVLYGSADGLQGPGRVFDQGSDGVPGAVEPGDEFGASLSALVRDPATGIADLIVGAPGEAIGTEDEAGALWLFFGSRDGLQGTASVAFNYDDANTPSLSATAGDRLGAAIETCNDCLYSDGQFLHSFWVGAPGAGRATQLKVEAGALVYTVSYSPATAGSGYGAAIAQAPSELGDNTMLAFGQPSLTVSGQAGAGGFSFLVDGLNDEDVLQGFDGIPGTPEAGDRFGATMDAADFNNDGYADLVIAAPDEAIGTTAAAGSVWLFMDMRDRPWTELTIAAFQGGSPGIPLDLEAGSRFGTTLATGDFDGDGFADLAIGAPMAQNGIRSNAEAGSVVLLYGSADGLYTAGVGPAAGPDGAFRITQGPQLPTAPPVATEAGAPEALALTPPAPNPTAATARMTLRLGAPAEVDVAVLDVLGRRVATLASGALAAGVHPLSVDTATLSEGIYLIRAATSQGTATTRLTIAR